MAESSDDLAGQLYLACGLNNITDIQRCLDAGVDPDHSWYSREFNGTTPLHWACFYNKPEAVKLLVERGADVEAIHGNGGHTPLHYACSEGSVECVQLLLDHHCDPDVENSDGPTPIQVAEMYGSIATSGEERRRYTEIVDMLNKYKEDQKQVDLFHKAVKSGGSRQQIIMQATFQGNARSGKTSFLKVILGKKANTVEPSTGVICKPARIELTRSAVLVDGHDWTPVADLEEEALLLVQDVVIEQETPDISVKIASTGKTSSHDHSRQPLPGASGPAVTNQTTSPPVVKLSHPVKRRVDKLLRAAARRAGMKMKNREVPFTIYLSDIGGQLEFQELIPALTNGPSLHIVVLRASRDLNSPIHIEYLDKNGQSAHAYVSKHTAKEDLLMSLATIMSTGRKGQLPKAIVVLTFKDKVTPDELIKIDLELQEAVKETEAYKAGVIVFADKTHLCHPINNLSPDECDLQSIRQTIEHIGKHNEEYKIKTPYSWLYFGIALRQLPDKVVSYETCVELSKECGVETKEEVSAALKFFHSNVGVIRHFSEVPELRDVVINEPQLLFDIVTELVVNTFTFDRVGHCAHEEFKKKGIFPAELVDQIATDSKLLTTKKFLSFLKYHNMIVPLEKDGVVTRYLLPCSLVHVDVQGADQTADICTSLMISFDTVYVPRGVFGFLLADLLNEKPDDEFSLVLDEAKIYRNQITLSVGPYSDKFRFSVRPTYIRIDVIRSPIDHTTLADICCFVRQRVSCGLSEIVKKLNYNCMAIHSLAFPCPDVPAGKDPHPAVVSMHRGEPKALKCTVSKEVKVLPKDHDMWFKKVEFHPASLAPGATSDGASLPTSHVTGPLNPPASRKRMYVESEGLKCTVCKKVKVDREGHEILFTKVEFHPSPGATNDGASLTTSHTTGPLNPPASRKRMYVESEGLKCTVYKKVKVDRESHEILFTKEDGGPDPHGESPSSLIGRSTGPLKPPDCLRRLRKALWEVRADWFELGIELDVAQGTLKAIRNDHNTSSMQFTALLSEWLEQSPKVEDLIDALKSDCFDRTDVANELESKIKNGELVLW